MNLTGANPPPNYFQGGYSPRSPCGSAAPASHNVIFKTQTSDLIEIIIELCKLCNINIPNKFNRMNDEYTQQFNYNDARCPSLRK